LPLGAQDVCPLSRRSTFKQLSSALQSTDGMPIASRPRLRPANISRRPAFTRLRLLHGRRAFGAEFVTTSRLLTFYPLPGPSLREIRRRSQILQERLLDNQWCQSRSGLSGKHTLHLGSLSIIILIELELF